MLDGFAFVAQWGLFLVGMGAHPDELARILKR